MKFEDNLQSRVDYFRKSVRLDSKATESDPEYDYSDSDLLSILEYSSLSLWGISVEDIPPSNFPIVLLKSKLEVYMRLATTTAPFYEISAEGASLKKNMRFDHYDKLIKRTQDEYDKMYEREFGKGSNGDEGNYGVTGYLETYNVSIDHIGGKYKQRDKGRPTGIYLEIEEIKHSSKNKTLTIEWTPYNYLTSSPFLRYEVFIDDKPIIDKYDPEYKNPVKPVAKIEEINRHFFRFKDVKDGEKKYIAVKTVNVKGSETVQELVRIPERELMDSGL